MGKAEGWRGRNYWVKACMSDMEMVEERPKYMAYCCAVRGNRETAVAGKMVAVNFSMSNGCRLPLNRFRIKAVTEGSRRALVVKATQ